MITMAMDQRNKEKRHNLKVKEFELKVSKDIVVDLNIALILSVEFNISCDSESPVYQAGGIGFPIKDGRLLKY